MTNALIPYRPTATSLATQTEESNQLGGLIKRGDTYHFRMRVPVRYKHIEPKTFLFRSLKTGDKREAQAYAAVVERQLISELDARLLGQETPGTRSHYEAIVALTNARGFSYRTTEELAQGDLGDLLRRVETLITNQDAPGSPAVTAVLGGVDRPRPTIMEVAESMGDRYPLEIRYKNHTQKRRWRARWERPAKKLIEQIGADIPLEDVTRENAVSLRKSFMKQIGEGKIKGGSAQKDLQNLNLLWEKFFKDEGFDETNMPPSPFRGLTDDLNRTDENNRKDEVPLECLENLMKPETLKDMNEQLRDLIYILAETGCRQAEVTDMAPSSIFLDAEIPYIWIRMERAEGDEREVKNKITGRQVPLLGAALEAMRRNPQGFPSYRGKDRFSAAANKFLKKHKLLPPGVTIGGLRHSFETRLKDAGVDSDDRGELMGHSVKRIRGREIYGNELTLEKRAELMSRITLPVERLSLPSPD